jgi:hypothetical protein
MEVKRFMQVYIHEVASYLKKIRIASAYLFFSLLLFPSIAFAYVDPGSVSILLQVVLAFFLGGILTFKKKIVRAIKSLYHAITFKK